MWWAKHLVFIVLANNRCFVTERKSGLWLEISNNKRYILSNIGWWYSGTFVFWKQNQDVDNSLQLCYDHKLSVTVPVASMRVFLAASSKAVASPWNVSF